MSCSETDTDSTRLNSAHRYYEFIEKRRKPDAQERRRTICDAAIQLLADVGSKGLSHLKVDRKAELPDGTASAYFRTRSALLRATAERLAELDLATLLALDEVAPPHATASESGPSKLAIMVSESLHQPQLSRTKARYELLLEAARDPVLASLGR